MIPTPILLWEVLPRLISQLIHYWESATRPWTSISAMIELSLSGLNCLYQSQPREQRSLLGGFYSLDVQSSYHVDEVSCWGRNAC